MIVEVEEVDWKIIEENPFLKVKAQKSSVKVNEFVPREVVDELMKKANPVWQVIFGDKKSSRHTPLCRPLDLISCTSNPRGRHSGVCPLLSGWPRLFHTIKLQEGRASRRAEGGGGGVSASLSRHFLSRGVRSAMATASRPHVADADVTMTLHEEEFFALWAAKARELVTINCPKYHPSNCKCRGTD